MTHKHDIYKYFDDFDDEYWLCKAPGCGQKIKKNKSKSLTGLIRHRAIHDRKNEAVLEGGPAAKQAKLNFKVVDKKEDFEKAVLRFFAAYGVPFQAVDSAEFSNMFAVGGYTKLTRQRLAGEILAKESADCDWAITSSVRNQAISICFDEYSKGNRRYVSLTAAFVDEKFCVHTKHIAVKSLADDRATAENLKILIEETLTRYQVQLTSVVAMTRDGGANIKKTAQLMDLPRNRSLKLANITRWNSTFEMLKSFLDLQQPLAAFSTAENTKKTNAAMAFHATLSFDLNQIATLRKCLAYIKDISIMVEGRRSSASLILYLLCRLKDYCNKPSRSQVSSALCSSFLQGFLAGLQKRYAEYTSSDVLLICSFLDPRFVGDYRIATETDWERAAQLVANKCELEVLSSEISNSTGSPSPPRDDISDISSEGNDDDWSSWNQNTEKLEVKESTVEKELKLYRALVKDDKIPVPKPDDLKTSTAASIRVIALAGKRKKDRAKKRADEKYQRWIRSDNPDFIAAVYF
ncbi:hypothetical protein QR680_009255 [Steinernema hermaphroditum]|uniref:DUF659 domain-containing protein n=1 Tax=Steinernema hermaphroditum TaxID=289476 RepID=A0AA39IM03_9BILA|nr:hypothetical protein QR680_009255 [Steinernema hermaphroditum]